MKKHDRNKEENRVSEKDLAPEVNELAPSSDDIADDSTENADEVLYDVQQAFPLEHSLIEGIE